MEKALDILTNLLHAKSYDENYPTDNEIKEALAELQEAMNKTCEWNQRNTEYDTSWEGTCGVKWLLIDGTPTENNMQFCPKCGGKLIEIESKEK